MISYRIPITGIKASTNKIYAGIHWAKRKELKDSVLSYAVGFCRPVQKAGPYPVEIRYRFVFISRALDTLNCSFVAKMFEDAFRAIGILEDDDPQHVARTILEVVVAPKKKSKKGPHDMGPEKVEKDEDWLEIYIESICKKN